MLKSSNLDSIIAEVEKETSVVVERPNSLDFLNTNESNKQIQYAPISNTPQNVTNQTSSVTVKSDSSRNTAQQLATGILQIFEPPLVNVRTQLKELIGKQNKIYIDLSAEKFKLDNAEMARLFEMMATVKAYREKLIKIKKQMQAIYQRTKVLKKRAANVQTCKQKELQRKLWKQQQEEALIGKQQ